MPLFVVYGPVSAPSCHWFVNPLSSFISLFTVATSHGEARPINVHSGCVATPCWLFTGITEPYFLFLFASGLPILARYRLRILLFWCCRPVCGSMLWILITIHGFPEVNHTLSIYRCILPPTLHYNKIKWSHGCIFFFFLIILHGKKSKQELMFSEWGTEETSLLQNRT